MASQLVMDSKEFNRLLAMWLYASGRIEVRTGVASVEVTEGRVKINFNQECNIEGEFILGSPCRTSQGSDLVNQQATAVSGASTPVSFGGGHPQF
jgi:hypothetical protein